MLKHSKVQKKTVLSFASFFQMTFATLRNFINKAFIAITKTDIAPQNAIWLRRYTDDVIGRPHVMRAMLSI